MFWTIRRVVELVGLNFNHLAWFPASLLVKGL